MINNSCPSQVGLGSALRNFSTDSKSLNSAKTEFWVKIVRYDPIIWWVETGNILWTPFFRLSAFERRSPPRIGWRTLPNVLVAWDLHLRNLSIDGRGDQLFWTQTTMIKKKKRTHTAYTLRCNWFLGSWGSVVLLTFVPVSSTSRKSLNLMASASHSVPLALYSRIRLKDPTVEMGTQWSGSFMWSVHINLLKFFVMLVNIKKAII